LLLMTNFWKTLNKPITVLAPMEEITDTVFRQVIASCGRPDVFFTEFTSTEGLFSKGRDAVIHRLDYSPQEHPIVAQIWGLKPENYYRAARLVLEMGFDGLDLNMGCPVPKIVKNGACSALIENEVLAKEVFLAAREGAGDLPVSIKTRIGYREKKTESWAEFLLALEPDVITVHPRIARDRSKKPANWDEVLKVVDIRNRTLSDTLIIGNGDVASMREIYDKTEIYGVDGVMVGRGILRDFLLFRRDSQLSFQDLSRAEKLTLLRKHIDLFEATWQERKYFGELKKFFKYYASGFRGAPELRLKLVSAKSLEEVRDVIDYWRDDRRVVLADFHGIQENQR
jgi:tRNA-dihydrouridine synthase